MSSFSSGLFFTATVLVTQTLVLSEARADLGEHGDDAEQLTAVSPSDPPSVLRPRLGAGVGIGGSGGGVMTSAHFEGGVQLSQNHGVSLKGWYGASAIGACFLVICTASSSEQFGVSALYSYSPVHWFELQVGAGIDRMSTHSSGYLLFPVHSKSQSTSRLSPTLDFNLSLLAGGSGSGSRAAFEAGLAFHLSLDQGSSVQLVLGFKLH